MRSTRIRNGSIRAAHALALAAAAALSSAGAGAQGTGRAALPPYHSPRPIAEPKLLGDTFISTLDFESHPAFAPDGRTLYFVKSTPDGRHSTILVSRFELDWAIPRVAPFSGKFSDADPCVTADGTRLVYASNRPAEDFIGAEPRPDLDLWMVEKTEDGWSAPRPLGPGVNGPANERSPRVAADGTLYFSSDRPGGRGGFDLYRARFENGKYGPAENLGDSVNGPADEVDPFVSDSGFLLFASNRAGGSGGLDLYVAARRDDAWSSPANLGEPVDSPGDESSPLVSPDGEYFFWTSGRSFWDQVPRQAIDYPYLLSRLRRTQNTLGDIYQIDLSTLRIPQ